MYKKGLLLKKRPYPPFMTHLAKPASVVACMELAMGLEPATC